MILKSLFTNFALFSPHVTCFWILNMLTDAILFIKAKVYTITDVEELHIWMRDHFNDHPLFRELTPQEYVRFFPSANAS